eukprot:Phypoly_transcript_01242.p1 GENE.Phypoly_transcript_01242~~Phypoly_transcript_01242.p1  ORF type:complete len:959 (+),score=137.10 Phypoly_transcript_01242:295-3171(+)
MANKQEVDENHKYAGTLNLPQTTFPMRANALEREPVLLKDVYDIYKWQEDNNKGPVWVTHDGPPYANGDLHLGHVLGKVLKDFVNRYKMLRGFRVSYVPGWDCHGLPIELKALEKLKESATKLTPQQLRATARAFALSEVEKQKATFKSWGVMGDWKNPYLTLHPEYEAAQLSLFYQMFENGYVYRGVRPVHWSPSSLTALADAELDYNDAHVSTSVYVAFKFKSLPEALELPAGKNHEDLYAVIWTTTPWTLPANVAVCANPDFNYAVVKNAKDSRMFVVAEERVQEVAAEIEMELETLCVFRGEKLKDAVCAHPFENRESPVCFGSHVTTESGTGLVHTAPGHGEDDFEVGKKYSLPVLCPVGPDGCFTVEAGDRFHKKNVLSDGNTAVLDVLRENNALLKDKPFKHKYPYDWRTKKPIIVRTTPQWFVDLTEVQSQAVHVVNGPDVRMVPPQSKTRLSSMLCGRSAWCISRQRSWGVPIPVFYTETGEPLITKETVGHFEQLVRVHGTDCWWNLDLDELLPPQYRNNGVKYTKGTDTMDVWFDSGVSWRAVLCARGIPCPADLYLEGSDQHRGWFQSSLLTSMCVTQKAPYKTVLTHGFVLDDKGRKMSKSVGNVIPPSLITHGGKDKKAHPAYGVDVLRFFVAASDYTRDVTTSFVSVARVAEALRDLRNRVRFMLSNTYDFTAADLVPYANLKEVDKYLLLKLYEFGKSVEEGYEEFNFTKVYKLLMNLCNLDLSAFYFELVKRRLYTEGASSPARRSAQTALFLVLDVMVKSVAPLLPHTVEDFYQHWPNKPYKEDSVFCTGWFHLKEEWNAKELENTWGLLMHVRDDVNKLLETMRTAKTIGRPEDADLELALDPALQAQLLAKMSLYDLAELFLVSNVVVAPTASALATNEERGEYVTVSEPEDKAWKVVVVARKSKFHKCARCWRLRSAAEGELCASCVVVYSSLTAPK